MTTIRSLLVANRGEIARRIFRTCRGMGITTAAVYARPDAGEPFVTEADVAVALNGTTSADTYLDGEKIIAAARRVGADALHPGYGFLSENAAFAQAVIAAGITWVGPNPTAIAAMGDKLEAKARMAAAGLPMLPGVDCTGLDVEAVARAADGIGYPVLVKAAAGGGGRGMRIVGERAALANALAAARREAKGAFGDDTVFLERYLQGARHVEVQVFGDKHGHVVHCFERECSIQRRHQKVIEEAPSPAVDDALRARMGAAAVAAAAAIGYDNAGTVEFMLDADGAFFFLEMNTRLQVEHPVTEAITGLDLVREQILVAVGEPLSFAQEDLRINGHAIEARLYAEDPENNFFPVSGRMLRFEPGPGDSVRVDSGIETGSVVSIYFDPMLAKVITHAPTRVEAAGRLAGALERMRLPGLVTNRDFLVNVVRHPAFLEGDTTTDFIERHAPITTREVSLDELAFGLLAAALHAASVRRGRQTLLRTVPASWRNNRSTGETASYSFRDSAKALEYAPARDGSWRCVVEGEPHHVESITIDGESIAFAMDGVRRQAKVMVDGPRTWVSTSAGELMLTEVPRFPERGGPAAQGGYTAPMPGKVVAVHAAPGEAVKAGALLIVLEAMKMEHRITAAADGVIREIRVSEGGQVAAGELLVVMEGGPDG